MPRGGTWKTGSPEPPGRSRYVSRVTRAALHRQVLHEAMGRFGFRHFAHYRTRAFLYAGKPNWTLLAGLTSR